MVGGLLTKKTSFVELLNLLSNYAKNLVKMSQLAQKLVLIYIFDDLFGTENHRSAPLLIKI